MLSQSARDRYLQSLRELPESGGGGLHIALLKVANYAAMAGVPSEQTFSDLRQRVTGRRHVPDGEIGAALRKAYREHSSLILPNGAKYLSPYREPKPAPAAQNPARARAVLIESAKGITAKDVAALSPVPIDCPVREQGRLLLSQLYDDDDIVFLGSKQVKVTAGNMPIFLGPAWGWCNALALPDNEIPELVGLNPLSSKPAPSKSDPEQLTYRGDNCVQSYRYTMAEFDEIPLPDQLAFWSAVRLPIAALVFSGGKSIHAWIHVTGVETAAQWEQEIKLGLYGSVLAPLGVDRSCYSPAHLARFPGHSRADTGKAQQLIYLNPQLSERPIYES